MIYSKTGTRSDVTHHRLSSCRRNCKFPCKHNKPNGFFDTPWLATMDELTTIHNFDIHFGYLSKKDDCWEHPRKCRCTCHTFRDNDHTQADQERRCDLSKEVIVPWNDSAKSNEYWGDAGWRKTSCWSLHSHRPTVLPIANCNCRKFLGTAQMLQTLLGTDRFSTLCYLQSMRKFDCRNDDWLVQVLDSPSQCSL
jgi:hypothetical protein